MIYFITGNQGKFAEIKAILPEIEQLDIDLPEIQAVDTHKIIKAKLEEARRHHAGDLIVEDTGVYVRAWNGLPGPLIKWFLKTVGPEGIAKMVSAFGDSEAEAVTMIGYAHGDEIDFFEGRLKGRIVAPRGDLGFGWDPIFMPEGYNKTFAEPGGPEIKSKISMRQQAASKLKVFLDSNA